MSLRGLVGLLPFFAAGCSAAAVLPHAGPLRMHVASQEWVPIEIVGDGLVFVPVRVNGVSARALLDCGTSMTLVAQGFAGELGLGRGLPIPLPGAAARRAALVSTGTIEIGAARLMNAMAAVIDLEDVCASLGRPTPMILGREFFETFVVDLDYPNRRIAFRDRARFEYAGAGAQLELSSTRPGLAVSIRLEQGAPSFFHVETGSNGNLAVRAESEAGRRLLADSRASSTALSGGSGRAREARSMLLDSLSIGEWVLRDLPIRVYPTVAESAGVLASARAACGSIGAGVLSRFHVIFDVQRERLILEPGPGLGRPFGRGRAGLQVLFRGAYLDVVHVAAGSPADHGGWCVGDRITAIDGQAIDVHSWRTLWSWSRAPAGNAVELHDGRGRSRSIVLADYY